MGNFLKFWWICFLDGFQIAHGIFGIIGAIAGLVAAALHWHSHIPFLTCYSEKWKDWDVLVKKAAFAIFLVSLLFSTLLVAPYVKNKETDDNLVKEKGVTADLRQQLADKSPKLNGFVKRLIAANEPGTSNSVIFVETTVDNRGGSASYAYGFSLKVTLSPSQVTNAEQIIFGDEYKLNILCAGKPYLLDLKRRQLIWEKTSKAIEPGWPVRGWAAFRLKGVPVSRYSTTNIWLSFLDITGRTICVTNDGAKFQTLPCEEGLARISPGSEKIFYPVEQVAETNEWRPPELPLGCSNVTVFFGGNGITEPRQLAEASDSAKRFAIKDLPDAFLPSPDRMPGYSPRQQYIWLKSAGSTFSIGGKTVPYPVQPVVVSNRLYIEVAIPFSNEKHRLVMSDAFDSSLAPLPLNWDRNYSTNYGPNGGIYAYEIVNELTNPVLQVIYSAPNEVHVNGIFQVESNSILASFGEQPVLGTFFSTNYASTNSPPTASLQFEKFHETLTIRSNETLASFGQRFTNEFFRPIFKYQRSIFKYPSNRHLGEFAESLTDDSKK